jgi:lincosamide nucleotidyltransferase A/C/D/E
VLSNEIFEVLDALDAAAVAYWVGGGWGVDALVGQETRSHRDLDLAVDCDDLEACLSCLARLGYAVETDALPLRVELAAEGNRWVDIHPVRFDARGCGVQGDLAGRHFRYPSGAFSSGRLGTRRIPCLSASQQEAFHTGYEPRPQDEHDLRLLAALRA